MVAETPQGVCRNAHPALMRQSNSAKAYTLANLIGMLRECGREVKNDGGSLDYETILLDQPLLMQVVREKLTDGSTVHNIEITLRNS